MRNSLVVKHRITLDLSHRGAQVTVPVTVADTLSQQITVTLRNGTETVELPDGTRAAIAIHNNADGTGVLDSCIVDHVNNAVIYTFSAPALSVAGNIACDITVFDKDGAALGTPRFNLFVEDTGADVTAEQLNEALKANGAWPLAQDVYINAENARKSAEEAAAEAAKLSGYQKEILDKLEADYVDITTFNGTVDNLATLEAVQNVREVAEGKCARYTAETLTQVAQRLNLSAYSPSAAADYYRVSNPFWTENEVATPLKTGDVILIEQVDVPDYWYNAKKKTLHKLETTKVDLTGYVRKVTTSSDVIRAYCVDTNGGQELRECSTEKRGNSLALRTADGRLAASEPLYPTDCVNKGYGDDTYLNKKDIATGVQAGVLNPITSNAVYYAIARATFLIDGKRLAEGDTATIEQMAYGEYEIHGDGATVTYNGKSHSGKIHRIILYSDRSTAPRYWHVSVGSSLLSGLGGGYGTLNSDIKIEANGLTFFIAKRARSGVDVD